MDAFKRFLRKYWVVFAALLCLATVTTWSAGGSLIGGVLSCAITALINYSILKWLLPERAEALFCRESFRSGLKYALPYLAAAAVVFALSYVRSGGLSGSITIDLGAVISFPVLAAAEVFLICGPVLHLMLNRFARDDVGVFCSVLYTGLVYGLAYFAYSCTYMVSIAGASTLAVIAQGVYIALSTMFLATLYLCSENFFLVLAARIVGLLLERGMEIFTPDAVNLNTLTGLTRTDCIIVLVIAVALGFLALNFSTNVPPWDKGDWGPRKKKEKPLPLRDYRLDVHRPSRLPKKRK